MCRENVEFRWDLRLEFICSSILKTIACNSVRICHLRTVLQVTNAACPSGEKYTGTRTDENVFLQVVIGEVPPPHDKVRQGNDTVHSCTLAHHRLLQLPSSAVRHHSSPVTEISRPESTFIRQCWHNPKHRPQGHFGFTHLFITWMLTGKSE